MKRCNVGKAGPQDLVDKLAKLALGKSDGIFWGADGQAQRPM